MKRVTLFVFLAFIFMIKSQTSFSQTSIPVYNISQVKGVDASGVADSLNVYCKLFGVINSINYTTTGLQFCILDQNNGIFVYKAAALTGFTFAKGDSIAVIGKIIQSPGTGTNSNYGTIAIAPDSIVVLSTTGTLQLPFDVIKLNNDSLESRLVKMNNLRYLSGWTGAGGGTRTIYTLHGTDTVIIRVPTTCNLRVVAAPTHTVFFSMAGFVNQNAAATPPYIGGYRLYPRDSNDYVVNYTNPIVYTGAASSITQTSAICAGAITSDGGHLMTTRGICWDTIADPDTLTNHITVAGTTGGFNGSLTGLSTGITYHYRAYGVNSLGLFYGADSIFTTVTTAVLPVVTTNAATNITTFSAVVTGNIINNGGDTLISHGICWSTSPIPTINDSVAYITGAATTYNDTIKNLNQLTTYYACAFAISDIGVGYGNIVSFTIPKLPPLYQIADVRTVNANGVADSLNVSCKLVGTVHGINFSNGNNQGITFFICDPVSGINVTKAPNTLNYTVNQGDLIRVIGKITQVNGLIEMIPDSLVLISTANTLNTPIVVNPLSDTYESRLVKMYNLTYVSGWPTTASTFATTVKTFNGTDTISLVIARYCNIQGTPAPTDTFTVVGLESQSDNSSPYTSGYFIYPRDTNDIIIVHNSTVGVNNNTASKPSFSVYPNPNNGNFKLVFNKNIDADVKIYSVIGTLVEERKVNSSVADFDIANYGKGLYVLEIIDNKTGLRSTDKLIVQ